MNRQRSGLRMSALLPDSIVWIQNLTGFDSKFDSKFDSGPACRSRFAFSCHRSGRDQEISCQAIFSTAVCHGRRFPGGKSGAIMISGSEAPLSPAAFCAAAGVKAEILDRFRRQERGRCSIGNDQGRDSKQGPEGGLDRGAVRFLLMRGTPACQSGRCLAQAAEGAGPGQPGERRVQDGHGRRRDI